MKAIKIILKTVLLISLAIHGLLRKRDEALWFEEKHSPRPSIVSGWILACKVQAVN